MAKRKKYWCMSCGLMVEHVAYCHGFLKICHACASARGILLEFDLQMVEHAQYADLRRDARFYLEDYPNDPDWLPFGDTGRMRKVLHPQY